MNTITPKSTHVIKFSKQYTNEYGVTQFSLDTFILDGDIGNVTEK